MKRLFTAGIAVLGLALSSAPVVAANPAPAVPSATPGPLAYYIMQGKTIVSTPFTDVNECIKAVAKIQKTVAPGNDQLVCAHRRP
jgi:hypothetical protein